MPSKKGKAKAPLQVPALLQTLASRSYFDLSSPEKSALRIGEESDLFKIDGWSFIPHPEVSQVLQSRDGPIARYVVTITTLRARIYFEVRNFLQSFTANVNSYYTGGSADFICDVHLTDGGYKAFLDELIRVLEKAGAGKIDEVKDLICIFRVDEALMLAGQVLSRFGRPDAATIKKIKANPATFQTLYRNYRSDASRKSFRNGFSGVRSYLEEMEKGRAIVGYKVFLDRCRYVDREYVPLCNGRAIATMLKKLDAEDNAILEPVVDLLRVRAVHSSDDEEVREVSHIFVNEYGIPGDRHNWRMTTYSRQDDLNVFTYPLEGTLNESPVTFTDAAEMVLRARQYDGELNMGSLAGDGAYAPRISIPLTSLEFHGVTLGMPGTGKTNTDLVLVEQAAAHLAKVVIIDGSKSVKEKVEQFDPALRKNMHFISVTADDVHSKMDECIASEGIWVIEAAGLLPATLRAAIAAIEAREFNTDPNQRRLEGLLMVEEAGDALGAVTDRAQTVPQLEGFLKKAFRKGWSVWLSTQRPIDLGSDETTAMRVLRLCGTRVVHQLQDSADLVLLRNVLDYLSADHQDAFAETVASLPRHTAVIAATVLVDNQAEQLPPVPTRINRLGADRTDIVAGNRTSHSRERK